ncbi:hypothetical protein GIB67_018219 [Kingdonia uniflora]|uniref:Protein OBERON 4 n=1 Tax=Kingdonia uniflora TaxID=39325 RepID=A0A7J7NMG6_9MAGN|nr:hypothetical protein GIB67_018219 [Kingdonia uniflora]
MKRLRSYDDDLESDWGRRDQQDLDRSSSHRSSSSRFHSKPDSGRKSGGLLSSSSSSYDRSVGGGGGDDDREVSRSSRKRLDSHDSSDGFDRRKSFDRYPITSQSPRSSYGGGERMYRSETFSAPRRDFPKGFRSERDRSRREESVSSWRRFRSGSKDKESEEDVRVDIDSGRIGRVLFEDRVNVRSPRGSKEAVKSKSPPQFKESSSGEQLKISEVKKNESPRRSREAVKSSAQGKDSGSEHSKSSEVKKNESPRGAREAVKSPSVTKESGSKHLKSVEVKKFESPRGLTGTANSPPASKDSGGQQSKCSEVKETESVIGESSSSSEMEEGELEPEPKPLEEPELEANLPSALKCEENKDLESGDQIDKVKKVELSTDGGFDEKQKNRMLETVNDVAREIEELLESEDNKIDEDEDNRGGEKADCLKEESRTSSPSPYHKLEREAKEEEVEDTKIEGMPLLPLDLDQKVEEKSLYLEVKEVGIGVADSRNEIFQTNEIQERNSAPVIYGLVQCNKDKGKSLAISPCSEANFAENGQWVERDLLMEGPSSRGFELFSTNPGISRLQNHSGADMNKDEKLKMEPLELSLGLSLPNVLLPLASHNPNITPSSPSHGRSVQSLSNTFRTNSDGFTTSISFSGSQTLNHNPSCSLTHNSFDNCEQSVGSRPIFQGVWPSNSSNEPNLNELSIYQRGLLNGTVSVPAPQASKGILNSLPVLGQQNRNASEEFCGIPISLDRQSSLSRQVSGLQSRNHNETKSSIYSFGSRETGSGHNKDKSRPKKERSGSLVRSSSQKEMEQLLIGGTGNGFVERILAMIVSEPIQIMAGRIQEMTELSISRIQESACEIIVNDAKRGQLHTFRQALVNRSDITLEALLKSHRAQLEIMVAFKTGLKDCLQKGGNIPSSDLAEVFLNMKCKNLTCLSLLPVDECECKVCSQKNGFCSACMCLICSKFDMASNTCSWVGCDVCLHWCHTDCGLREMYIRNGRSVSGPQGTTEMQFHCVACKHPSEMFGFVKEVFKTCAKEWKAETLSMELEYVRKIFSASNDSRGKRLCDAAEQLRARLQNKSNLSEVYNHIMGFLTENDSERIPVKELSNKNPSEASIGIARPVQEAMWLTSISTENASHRGNASTSPNFNWDQIGKRSSNPEIQNNVEMKPAVDELESIVRIKQAEAKMFQTRADDARREAEGLKRIAFAKNEKIDEDYSKQITKLRFLEAEERRKQKLEELQIIERAYRDYFSMKMKMETDIRDLLVKMEAAKRNLST